MHWLDAFAKEDCGPVERRCRRGTQHFMVITFDGSLTGGGATLRADVVNVKDAQPVPSNRHHCISRTVVLLIVQALWPVSNSACNLPRTAAFSSPTKDQGGASDVLGSLACTFGPSTRRSLWLRPALGHVGVVRLPVRLVAPTRRQCYPRCLQGSPCSSCCKHPDWPATVNRALYHPDASSVGTRLLARDTRVFVAASSARIRAPRPMRTTCLPSLPRSCSPSQHGHDGPVADALAR